MIAKQEEQIVVDAVDCAAVFATEDAPSRIARPSTTPEHGGSAPDTYAVAVHILRIAPAWFLVIAVAFVLLTLMLGWVKPGADASGEAYLSPNDSKVAATVPAASPAPAFPAEKQSVAVAPVANGDARPTATSRVEPAPQSSTPSAAPESRANESGDAVQKFTVQVGSHNDESEANEQTSRLRSAGFDARTVLAELPGRGKWYRVQAGSFDDRGAASKEAAAMRAKGVAPEAIVVPQ
ncbi:MAG TPA: SPOR domain-containing protein [Pyrinomonadaceae bacterium]|nr:SPOR domain-containing protein [Pyrinomonadaceae bacterium]